MASSKGSVALNGTVVTKLIKAGENELGYVFGTLDDYLEKRSQFSRTDDLDKPGEYAELDIATLARICSTYVTPDYYTVAELQAQGTHASFLDRKPSKTPSYHMMGDIPVQIAEMARFNLGIPAQETIIALTDLTINGGNASAAFVVTQRGIRSRDESGKKTVFLSWDALSKRSVAAEIMVGRHWAIKLDNGDVLTISNRNAVVKPYGAALIRDLIALASNGERSTQVLSSLSTVASPIVSSGQDQTQPAVEKELALAVVEAVEAQPEAGVESPGTVDRTTEKLKALVRPIVEQNQSWIVSTLKEKTGELSIAALRNDDVITKVATALYALLPGVVRFAVKEEAFITFVLQNRDKLLAPVVKECETVSAETPASSAVTPARKRLADLKSPAATRTAPGVGRFVSEHFPKMKSELSNAVREFDRLARSATPRERNSVEFQDAEQKRRTFALVVGLTDLALTFPRKLAARDAQWNGANQIIMLSDRAVAESMIYCIASGGDLLRKEADLDEDDLADIFGEITMLIFYGYFIQEASLRDKRILLNPNSERRQLDQFEQTEVMQRWRDSMRRFSINKSNDDTDNLVFRPRNNFT
ncbi:hypothetical protein BVER_00530c [Candidatus Burkholderia verschuerenii]|uniref:Uncharacterized protein n=1 Tax=Candidatus Burkholderia verschuerenii TaxID=242163 RepID=A0A0L0MCG4_9BURK|nr:hypothetical protein [Candidatus Burkholderia verschuerenii]KND59644.1 hypothetical protein BVER_00530c [Candidatus Burkholderia verschuerenii]